MHKCLKCGQQFDGKFCPECGTKWIDPEACPKCGAHHEPNAKFCQECGARLDGKVNCPKCGALMDATAAFCGECGASLRVQGNGKAVSSVGAVAVEKTAKGEKVKFILTLSGLILIMLSALMGLVFTFVSGVSTVDIETGKAVDTQMLYHYFGDAYKEIKTVGSLIKEIFGWKSMGEMREFALFFPVVLGTVVSALGMLGVVALSGLTGFKAYKKFCKNEEANVVAPAVATYFTFVAMATVLLMLDSGKTSDIKTAFSAPTLAGLITGGVLLALGMILLMCANYKKFNGFNAMVGTICSLAVCALIVVVISIVSLPAGGMTVFIPGISSGISSMLEDATYGLFGGMQSMLLLIRDDDAIIKIIAFGTIGGVAGIALAVTSAVTVFRKTTAVCNGENKRNIVLGAVIAALAVVYLVFTILLINSMIDSVIEATGASASQSETIKDMITTNYAVPIALVVMAALACVAELIGAFVRKKEGVETAEQVAE